MIPLVRKINPMQPQPDIIDAAAAVIRDGGVVILPTRGLYGLGCDASQPTAVKRIFDIKNRPADKPLLVLISHRRMLFSIVAAVPPMAAHLMDAFWPGKATLVMEGQKDLPPGLCSNSGKVGVRLAGHPVAAALVTAVGRPITGTSANLSGAGGLSSVDAMESSLKASVDMILDAGPLAGGPGSTVIDATGPIPHILREGAVAADTVQKVFDRFAASRVDKGG